MKGVLNQMSNKEIFMKELEELITKNKENLSSETVEYFETLKITLTEDKEAFTKNGRAILLFLQQNPRDMWKSKDIADAMEISSRSVSGSMRKLVTDGYVDKLGKDPVIYALTEKGKKINLIEGVEE
jgi:DNA-binding MarR family transcriptional regulator